MKSSKLSTAEMLELIPFRGRDLDSNYYVYCKNCENRQRLWYRSAKEEMREKMKKGLSGRLDCPACLVKKGVKSSVVVLSKIPLENAIKDLYIMSQSEGIDYDKADRDADYQKKQDKEAEIMQEKTEWYLQKYKN